MGLLTPTRRVYHRWRMVLQLYDGRSCPDCGAIVCGREDRRVHRERHMQERAWQEWAADSIIRIARAAGLPVIDNTEAGELEGQGDDYQRVDLTGDDEEEEDYGDE